MPRRSYSDDFRLRVVAVASVRGVPEAARQFKVGQEAIRAWQQQWAGTSAVKLAEDLALSELTLEIAEGKNRGRLSTHYGILRDKRARYEKAAKVDPASIADRLLILRNVGLGWSVEGDKTEAEVFWAAFETWLEEDVPEAHRTIAWHLVFGPLSLEWHRRRGVDVAERHKHDPLNAERWDSALPDVIDNATDLVDALLLWATNRVTSLGDLGVWEAERQAAELQHRAEMAELGRRTALEYQQRVLDAESKATIAAAEEWLASQSIEIDAADRLDALLPER
jgi:transposase-like protein